MYFERINSVNFDDIVELSKMFEFFHYNYEDIKKFFNSDYSVKDKNIIEEFYDSEYPYMDVQYKTITLTLKSDENGIANIIGTIEVWG